MCKKIECSKCNKPTWMGCGMHIEEALKGVPTTNTKHAAQIRRENLIKNAATRAEYRTIIDLVKDETDDRDGVEILKIVKTAINNVNTNYLPKVEEVREAIQDTHFMSSMIDLVLVESRRLETGEQCVTMTQLVDGVNRFVYGLNNDPSMHTDHYLAQRWSDLGMLFYRQLPGCAPFVDRLEVTERVRTAVKRTKPHSEMTEEEINRLNASMATTKEKLSSASGVSAKDHLEDDSTGIKEDARRAYKALKSHPDGVDYLQFVLDTNIFNGFAATIENIFATSFLVKEQRAFIYPDEYNSGIILIKPASVANDHRNSINGSNNLLANSKQFVMNLNYTDWLNLIKLYPKHSLHIPRIKHTPQ